MDDDEDDDGGDAGIVETESHEQSRAILVVHIRVY